jgi:hypothetical protein
MIANAILMIHPFLGGDATIAPRAHRDSGLMARVEAQLIATALGRRNKKATGASEDEPEDSSQPPCRMEGRLNRPFLGTL